jgi:hypothetical protein
MKTFGAGTFEVHVEMKNGEDEIHYFMTAESRRRFINAIKNDKSIKKMHNNPK